MRIKLKGSPGIFIVGFMGCGKSTAGRALSRRIGWKFVDLDDEIERRAGKSITAIFDEDGEDGFRGHEHEAVKEQAGLVLRGRPRVVALGAGRSPSPGTAGRSKTPASRFGSTPRPIRSGGGFPIRITVLWPATAKPMPTCWTPAGRRTPKRISAWTPAARPQKPLARIAALELF